MKIKTLADILADSDHSSAQNSQAKNSQSKDSQAKKQSQRQKHSKPANPAINKVTKPVINQSSGNTVISQTTDSQITAIPNKRKKKKWHPAATYQADTSFNKNNQPTHEPTLNIKDILQQVKEQPLADNKADDKSLDNLPTALTAYLKTPEQREAEKEQLKADSRMRWLAFYYLSTREHSRQELKDKLIAKDQDPDKVEALLDEFAEKGYQSEQRAAIMLIKEGIRKGRGRRRIEHDFRQRKIDVPANIDEMIELAQSESQSFADYVESDADQVDWLKLAVETRVKKYGDAIPTTPKDKAKQLRFLQYRGFKTDVCYQAIKLNLQDLDSVYH